MHIKILIFSTVLILITLFTGCGGPATPTNSPGKNAGQNANAPVANNDNPLQTNKKPEAPTTNNAPTLAPVFKAYCEALLKKDEAALRKVYSAETLKIFEKDMKDDKKASLVEFLSELDKIKDAAQCVSRNEKIEGDKGVAEIKSETMTNWIPIEFVKENGEWKLTNKSSDLSGVKDSASNSKQ